MRRRTSGGILLLTIALLAAFVFALNMPQLPQRLTEVTVSYQDLETKKIISNSEQLKLFTGLLDQDFKESPQYWHGRREITFTLAGQQTSYLFDGSYLYDNENKKRARLTGRTLEIINENFNKLSSQVFAPLVPWAQADKAFPRKSRAKVTDLETGLSFWLQRRGGTYHADVQPLTAQDTAIMKKIFSGRWTWKRRAVILDTGKRKMAASMNGMPHGQGALANDFPGHFCIHFYNSLTHGSRSRDPAHHLMMLKAAGQIEEHLQEATPQQVAEAFWLAVEQQDQHLLAQTSKITDKEQLKLLEIIDDWADINFTVKESRRDAHTEMFYSVPTDLYLLAEGSQRRLPRKTVLSLSRENLDAPWLVDLNLFYY